MSLYRDYSQDFTAQKNAGTYLDENDWLNTGVDKPLDFNYGQTQMPYGAGIDTSVVPTSKNFLENTMAQGRGLYADASDSIGDATSGWTAKGFSDVVGGLGGLYQMYQGNQMMKLAKKDMANRTNAYKTARRDKDNFLSASKSVFA